MTAYNAFMGGVDLSDFLREMYNYSLKSRKWYVYLFNYGLQLAVRNAAILYRRDKQALDMGDRLGVIFTWKLYINFRS